MNLCGILLIIFHFFLCHNFFSELLPYSNVNKLFFFFALHDELVVYLPRDPPPPIQGVSRL